MSRKTTPRSSTSLPPTPPRAAGSAYGISVAGRALNLYAVVRWTPGGAATVAIVRDVRIEDFAELAISGALTPLGADVPAPLEMLARLAEAPVSVPPIPGDPRPVDATGAATGRRTDGRPNLRVLS